MEMRQHPEYLVTHQTLEVSEREEFVVWITQWMMIPFTMVGNPAEPSRGSRQTCPARK